MAGYSEADAARRAGVPVDGVARMMALGMIAAGPDGQFSEGAVRQIGLLWSLVSSGIPDTAIAEAVQRGWLSLQFLDSPEFGHFSALSSRSFDDLSAETGIPVGLLLAIREAIGSSVAEPEDLVRDIELSILPAIEAERAVGYPDEVVERLLRTLGESLRRYVLSEADAFRDHVIRPVAHLSGREIGEAAQRATARIRSPADDATLAIYHAQQAQAWTANILQGFEESLAKAGLYSRIGRPPAMCFLDITGYTRLTAEHGDRAAAELADKVGRLVTRTSVRHGGRPVKWLGDGVMLWFRDPGPAVVAALEMSAGIVSSGLPPTHVGLHAGPVLVQDGDYYGQTVNIASRIADYARPGEVLVSQAVVEAMDREPVAFTEIGPVELKGVGGAIMLFSAKPA
jgi:adenylate cyclase